MDEKWKPTETGTKRKEGMCGGRPEHDVRNWKESVGNRRECCKIVEEVKTHTGL